MAAPLGRFFLLWAYVIQNLNNMRNMAFEGGSGNRSKKAGKLACFALFCKGQTAVAEGKDN